MPMLRLNDMLYWLFMFSYKMFKQVPKVLRYQVPSYPGIQTGTPGPRYLGTPSHPTTRQVHLVLRYQIPKYPGTQTGTQALLPFIDSDIIHGMCILMIHYIYMTHSQMFQKVESGWGPIFKVVLECLKRSTEPFHIYIYGIQFDFCQKVAENIQILKIAKFAI